MKNCKKTNCRHYHEIHGTEWCISCIYRGEATENHYEPWVKCSKCGYEMATDTFCFKCWEKEQKSK